MHVGRRRLMVTVGVAAASGIFSTQAAAREGTCPTSPFVMPAGGPPGGFGPGMGPPPGMPPMHPGMMQPGEMPPGGQPPLPSLPMAKTVAPSDASTSTVITPDGADQIHCGKVQTKTFANVPYSAAHRADGARPLLLDILVPQTSGKKPLVIFVPGGGFIIAPKEGGLNLRTYVAEAGFVVASITYRTALDGARYQDGVADVKAAIRYLRAHADQYGIDPAKVALWGESAGGYLVSMAGVTNGDPTFERGENLDQSSTVQAVVDKFGPSDLSQVAADFDAQAKADNAKPGPTMAYIGGLTPTGGLADPASDPLRHIASSAPPFLILHGTKDRLVSPSQTLLLHDGLKAKGLNSTRYLIEGADHGDLAFLGNAKAGLLWSSRQTMDLIVNFLNATLR